MKFWKMITGAGCPDNHVNVTVVDGCCAVPLTISPCTVEPTGSATVYVPSPKPQTCTVPLTSVKKAFVTFYGSVTSNSQF